AWALAPGAGAVDHDGSYHHQIVVGRVGAGAAAGADGGVEVALGVAAVDPWVVDALPTAQQEKRATHDRRERFHKTPIITRSFKESKRGPGEPLTLGNGKPYIYRPCFGSLLCPNSFRT